MSKQNLISYRCILREQLCMSRGVRQSQLPTALLRLCACAPGLTGQLSDWCMRLVKKNLNSNIRKLSILKPYIF